MAEEIRDCGVIEARLAPYLDGEESSSMRESIAAHLAACPPCRAHAEAESTAREILQSHRGELRPHAPDALRARCTKLYGSTGSSFVRRWMPLSLAATVVLGVGAAFLYSLNNPLEALAFSLAADHVACFNVGAKDTHDHLAAAKDWRQAEGWPLQIPQTMPSEQLELVDVRRCLSADGRAAHLMYTYRGKPLSLYILPEDKGHSGTTRHMGRDAVVWCAKGRTYAVVADGHPPDLNHVVDYMKANAE